MKICNRNFRTFGKMKAVKIFVAIFFIACKTASAQDFLFVKVEDEKSFVVHHVLVHQNLYRISRYYQTTAQDIKTANNLIADTLRKGQDLLIPLNKKNFSVHASSTKKNVDFQMLFVQPNAIRSEKKLAAALPIDKEIWYTFLKKKQVNFKENKTCLIGYLVTLDAALEPPTTENTETKKAKEEKIIAPKIVAKKDSVKPILMAKTKIDSVKKNVVYTMSKTKIISPQQKLFDKLFHKTEAAEKVEKGTALGMMPDTLGNYQKGFYAFHNTLSVGTIVRLKNPMNDNEVFVKILGNIPELAGNQRCSIKISHDAALYLDAIDERFLVEIYSH